MDPIGSTSRYPGPFEDGQGKRQWRLSRRLHHFTRVFSIVAAVGIGVGYMPPECPLYLQPVNVWEFKDESGQAAQV